MHIQCPNCGGFDVVIEENKIGWIRVILCLLTLGVYDPWAKEYSSCIDQFKLGIKSAICEICGYQFRETEKVEKQRIIRNMKVRIEGERRLYKERQSDKDAMKNYPTM
jgi:C4-type Zn-finger protein